MQKKSFDGIIGFQLTDKGRLALVKDKLDRAERAICVLLLGNILEGAVIIILAILQI